MRRRFSVTLIVLAAVSVLAACGSQPSDGGNIQQLDLNQPTAVKPSSPPEEGALPVLDDAVQVGTNDACHATYYTKKSPEEAIIAVNALFKAKGFRMNPNSRQTQSMSNLTNEAWVTSRTGKDLTFINAVYPVGYEFSNEWDPMQGVATDTVVQIVYKQYVDDSGNCMY
jgi:hypothetical protein